MTTTPDDHRAKALAVRSHTNRIRSALRELPSLSAERLAGMNREQDIREVLQEILGSASAIAEYLEVEL